MSRIEATNQLFNRVQSRFSGQIRQSVLEFGEITIETLAEESLSVLHALRDEFGFEQLMDICGVDYLQYGLTEWNTQASATGFSRAVNKMSPQTVNPKEFPHRFAVVYHLLSLEHNLRIRVRVFAKGEVPCVKTVIDLWSSANWYEREAYDLYGILFEGHPDLRRILTDYGFIGYPFRKDFPLSGTVEMRYDPIQGRIIYEPVSIETRTLVPRVIR